jgi:hypothetical protein
VRARGALAALACGACAACGGSEAPPQAASLPATPPGAAPAAPAPFSFTDATPGSGLALTLTSGGDPPRQIVEVKGGGLALLDFDGDGDLDVFAPNGAALEDPAHGAGARLFANDGDLRFRDATAQAGVAFAGWGMGVAAGDVDGNGCDDLFIAAYGPDALLLNTAGRFADATAAAGLGDPGWGTGSALGDLDQDGDLDLYLARYLELDLAAPPPPTRFLGVEVFAGPAGLTPLADRLYLNDGGGAFADATAASGCADVRPSYGLGCLILDFDEDGLADVFVGNDSMPNFLFAGRGGGRFEDVALKAGVAVNGDGDAQATMGIAYGDVNGDGRADLFTTNFMNDTDTLFASLGAGLSFADRSQLSGLGHATRPFLGWAAIFCDLDQDADEDLVAFNGHVYPEAAVKALGSSVRQTPLCFEREGERFRRVEPEPGSWLAEPHNDRSAVCGDLDGDLDLDLVVGERNGPVRLLRNDGAAGPALLVRLRDARPGARDRRGLGAKVTLLAAGGERQVRWIASGGSYLSASAPDAHFGLGALAGPFALEVRWPDGAVQRLDGETAGRVEVVRE